MKRTRYTIDGLEVLGYRFGPVLAVRDKMPECLGPRDREKCKRLGRWILEHIPTGTFFVRGWYQADLVGLARMVSAEDQELWLSSSDVSEVVDNLHKLAEFRAAVMNQREEMRRLS